MLSVGRVPTVDLQKVVEEAVRKAMQEFHKHMSAPKP